MQSIEHKNVILLCNVSFSSAYWVDRGVSVGNSKILSVDTYCGGENVQIRAVEDLPWLRQRLVDLKV